MKTNHFIVVVSLGAILAGCGSQENSGSSSRGNANPTITGNSNLNGTPSVSLSGAVYAGNDTTFQPSFINGYEAKCIDGQSSVSWKVVGDSSKISIADGNKCRPNITTATNFDGTGTIQGNLYTADEGLVRFTGTLALKRPIVFDNSKQISSAAASWLKKDASNKFIFARPDTGQLPDSGYWFPNDRFEFYVYGGAAAPAELKGKIIHYYGYNYATTIDPNYQNGSRKFEINLKDISNSPALVSDPDNQEDSLEYTVDCLVAGDSTLALTSSCPFAFDPIDKKQRIVSFRLKEGARVGTVAAPYAHHTGRFTIEDVYKLGFPSGERTIAIQLTVKHPNTSMKDAVTKVIGSIKFYINVLN